MVKIVTQIYFLFWNKKKMVKKYRHVKHGGDAQSDFLARFCRNEEDKPERWRIKDCLHLIGSFSEVEQIHTKVNACLIQAHQCPMHVQVGGLKTLYFPGGTQKSFGRKTRKSLSRHTKKVRNHLLRRTIF